MSDVTLGALSDAGVLDIGDGYRTKRSEHGQPGYRILRVADVADGRISHDGGDFVSAEHSHAIGAKLSQPGDVLLTTKGTVGRVAVYPPDAEPVVYSPQLCYFRVKEPRVLDARYLAYWFKSESFKRQASHRANNTDMAAYINLRDIRSLQLTMADIERQQAIADILGALDDKIAANNLSMGLLDDWQAAQFSKSIKRAGRRMLVGDLAEFHNRRRVPLSSREREIRTGSVPYYGAAGQVGLVDEALFNEPMVLVGEDGTVVRANGQPVVQYVWGPAWVNNHAHVLTGEGISTELLRLAIEPVSVAHLITGAVQPKLSMGNLRKLELIVPVGPELERLEPIVHESAALARALTDENERLAASRDELLPLLMSGKFHIKDIEGVA